MRETQGCVRVRFFLPLLLRRPIFGPDRVDIFESDTKWRQRCAQAQMKNPGGLGNP